MSSDFVVKLIRNFTNFSQLYESWTMVRYYEGVNFLSIQLLYMSMDAL